MTQFYELCPQHAAPLFRYGSETYCLHDWLTGLVGQPVVEYVPETDSTPLVLVLASRCVLPVQALWFQDDPGQTPLRASDQLYRLRLTAFRPGPEPGSDLSLEWAQAHPHAALMARAAMSGVYTEFWTATFFARAWPTGQAPRGA